MRIPIALPQKPARYINRERQDVKEDTMRIIHILCPPGRSRRVLTELAVLIAFTILALRLTGITYTDNSGGCVDVAFSAPRGHSECVDR